MLEERGCCGMRRLPREREYGASQTREQGIDVFCGTVEEYERSASGETFDVITMSHVLEHVPEPVKALEAMRHLLADDGVVVLALPNGAYWAWRIMKEHWLGYQVPVHLMHFSLKSLARCSERAGFKVESMGTQCEPHAVASTLRRLLRSRLFVPWRISAHLKFIDHPLAGSLGKRWDAKDRGEALVAHLKAG